MEDKESSAGKGRKRTESNGGSSDSDLSEGWNVIDQMDVNNHDTPSSDGESIEVIEGDEEIRRNDGDSDSQESLVASEAGPLAITTETPVVPVEEGELPIPGPHGEMFDSSFCWFLFFTMSAMVISNLAFMAADRVLDWNMDMSIDSPSFLRDLPVTPKPARQNNFPDVVPWAGNEEVVVDTVDDTVIDDKQEKVMGRPPHSKEFKEIYNKYSNSNKQRRSLKIDDRELGRHLKVLRDVATSAEVQSKLEQALVILDALHIGLNELEEVVTDNSELNRVVTEQKYKLGDVLDEMEFGVSRALERLAMNILNKAQKLELRFESEWCRLEREGHKDKLKGLFYDCHDSRERGERDNDRDDKQYKDNDREHKYKEKYERNLKIDQYEVDRDSTGKEYSKPHGNYKGNFDYDELMRPVKQEKQKLKHDKSKQYDEEKYKYEKHHSKEKYYKKDKDREYHSKEKYYDDKKKLRDINNEETTREKAPADIVSEYLKNTCGEKHFNNYQQLKETVDELKLKIHKKMFDSIYDKYCKKSDESFKWNKNYKKENLKGDYSAKTNDKTYYRNEPRIIDDRNAHVRNVEIRVIDNQIKPAENKIIESTNKPRQWMFSYEEDASENKSNISGDWFIRAGESRSKTRCLKNLNFSMRRIHSEVCENK